jgi:hypothetical protein
LHDFWEGAVAYDLFGVIKCLKMEGWFTVEEYNDKLRLVKMVVFYRSVALLFLPFAFFASLPSTPPLPAMLISKK